MSGICNCDHLPQATWKYMSFTDKYENYCESCGFECMEAHKVIEGAWCELFEIKINKLV